MKRKSLWQISVTVSPQAEEMVSALFEKVFERSPVVYVDAQKNVSVVSVYSDKSKEWIFAQRSGLKSALLSALRFGTASRSAQQPQFKISVKKLRREDWAESWKKHFRPLEIGPILLLKPSWSKHRARKKQAVVVLNPGLSFGTGQHPTTEFCLRQLVAHRDSASHRSFLDIGTGSGILAIAAAKLGYAPVEAFDSDSDSVRIATANAKRNRVHGKILIRQQDVAKLSAKSERQYDLICANLVANLLVEQRKKIIARLKPGGVLALAGILKTEFPQVQRAYEAAGLKLFQSRAQKEWRSGAFQFEI